MGVEQLKDIEDAISESNYISINIPKKNGTRTLTFLERGDTLRKYQEYLLKKVFALQEIPICAKGFKKGSSYKEFLSEHIGSNYFLRVDIHNFFNSIHNEAVREALSFIVTIPDKDEREEVIDIICSLVTHNNCLPQGISTSPMLSNIVFKYADQRILKYCQKLEIKYTRYADDLLFSSTTFNFKEKQWLLGTIKHILSDYKFKINYSKNKVSENEISLNGFVIDRHTIRLSRTRLSDVKGLIYCVKQPTMENCLKTKDKDTFLFYLNLMKLKHKDLSQNPFDTIYRFIQYLAGYRAFLISWIDSWNSSYNNQKDIIKLIRKVENIIDKIYDSGISLN